jgi:S1-C subfamily serine protease
LQTYANNSAVRKADILGGREYFDGLRNPAPGTQMVVLGNALGLEMSFTTGVVSRTSDYMNIRHFNETIKNSDGTVRRVRTRVIRTDAAINPGNSGGGMFDSAGRLIGIVQAFATNAVNISYGIPLDITVRIYDQILERHDTLGSTPTTPFQLEPSKYSFQVTGVSDVAPQYKCVVHVGGAVCPGDPDVFFGNPINEGCSFIMITSETVFVTNSGNGLVAVKDSNETVIGGDIIESITIGEGVGARTYTIKYGYQVADILIEAWGTGDRFKVFVSGTSWGSGVTNGPFTDRLLTSA